LEGEISTAEMQRQIRKRLATPRSADIGQNLAKSLRSRAKGTTETYITYGLTQTMFKTCSKQASYFIPEDQRTAILTGRGPPKTASGEDLGVPDVDTAVPSNWWFNDIGMDPTFSTWSQVTYLHMYLLTVRLRALDSQTSFQNYQRYLLEHFSHAAEDKMLILHGMSARGIRNRYLKDLFIQWRGLLAAYDEGLVKGDAVLAGAVWRNLFKGDEEVDWIKVSVIVGYMRRVAAMLGSVEINEIAGAIEGTDGIFVTARQGLFASLAQKSTGIDEPFGKEE
jgi:cytochrome b pre-mRNA-processing protein 3